MKYEDRPLLERGLPKWPGMLVTGKPIKIAQAKEIIRRTDYFFQNPEHSGSDHAFNKRVMRLLNIPDSFQREVTPRENTRQYIRQEEWRRQWGFIQTQYVHNNWIASSYVYGPHGWAHPDGKIQHAHNVGKWPSCQDIYEDWVTLAAAFPFIDLSAVLVDDEIQSKMEPTAVCGFRIQNGQVEIFSPTEIPEKFDEIVSEENDLDITATPMCSSENEHGIPYQWIEDWAAEHVVDLSKFDAEQEEE